MPSLKENLSLKDIQRYVQDMEKERGFEGESAKDKCLLLGEEIGELFKSIRKAEGLPIDENSSFGNISHELADIFVYLCAIANRFGIDLEKAFRDKEKINKHRVWRITEEVSSS